MYHFVLLFSLFILQVSFKISLHITLQIILQIDSRIVQFVAQFDSNDGVSLTQDVKIVKVKLQLNHWLTAKKSQCTCFYPAWHAS